MSSIIESLIISNEDFTNIMQESFTAVYYGKKYNSPEIIQEANLNLLDNISKLYKKLLEKLKDIVQKFKDTISNIDIDDIINRYQINPDTSKYQNITIPITIYNLPSDLPNIDVTDEFFDKYYKRMDNEILRDLIKGNFDLKSFTEEMQDNETRLGNILNKDPMDMKEYRDTLDDVFIKKDGAKEVKIDNITVSSIYKGSANEIRNIKSDIEKDISQLQKQFQYCIHILSCKRNNMSDKTPKEINVFLMSLSSATNTLFNAELMALDTKINVCKRELMQMTFILRSGIKAKVLIPKRGVN